MHEYLEQYEQILGSSNTASHGIKTMDAGGPSDTSSGGAPSERSQGDLHAPAMGTATLKSAKGTVFTSDGKGGWVQLTSGSRFAFPPSTICLERVSLALAMLLTRLRVRTRLATRPHIIAQQRLSPCTPMAVSPNNGSRHALALPSRLTTAFTAHSRGLLAQQRLS
jgi:hypothetical protein